jgi:pimeloyl-ACP methyl ester carboxylesterase
MPRRSAPVIGRRDRFVLDDGRSTPIALQLQRSARADAPDVLYVHGATFGVDLSVFFPFENGSWADALNLGGFHAWGFDFVGFGASGRYPRNVGQPAGTIEDALQDLRRTVVAVRERNRGRPVVLLAHSRGGAVAARHAGEHPDDVAALVLFAPIVPRSPVAAAGGTVRAELPSHHALSAWTQYRRFIEDLPRGEPQVLAEADMQAWVDAFLASDADSGTRQPPAVLVPTGPLADIAALWGGTALYEPAAVTAPTLIVRGEWDSVCTDRDAARLQSSLGAAVVRDVKIPRATHLMHLEAQRTELRRAVVDFLAEVLA